MNLLAVDCASQILSAAVSKGDEIFYTEEQAGMKQSELAMVCVDSLMKEAGLLPKDLNGVLCMGGPGSFTGLRIGYSIAKGLALSLSIPFAPVPTLDCVAYGIYYSASPKFPAGCCDPAAEINSSENKNGGSLILAVIEARKNAYFYAFFRGSPPPRGVQMQSSEEAPAAQLPAWLRRITIDKDGDAGLIAAEIEACGETVILTGGASDLLEAALRERDMANILPNAQKRVILNNGEKGYAKEIIAVAQMRKILDNIKNNILHLNSGPDYNRLTDAELSTAPRK